MNDPWFYRRRLPDARFRLFCLPYAGGGAPAYARWPDEFAPDVEVCAVELPGRRSRLAEPAMRSMDALSGAVADGIEEHLDLPFALFGHSLGALVAFETARRLLGSGRPAPRALFLSGAAAPHLPKTRRALWHLPREELLEEIRDYGGTPPDILDERSVMELFLPALRADFQVFDTYRAAPEPSVRCPVHVYGGEQDDRATPLQLWAWRDLAHGPFTVRMFPGDHFYLHAERTSLIEVISDEIAGLRAAVIPGTSGSSHDERR